MENDKTTCSKCGEKIDGGLEICGECGTSLNRAKNCWLATLALICVFASVAAYAELHRVFDFNCYENRVLKSWLEGSFWFVFSLSPVLGIFALIKIYRSNRRVSGQKQAGISIIAYYFFLFVLSLLSAFNYTSPSSKRSICTNQLSRFSRALCMYIYEHDDMYPRGENWCDLLISEAEISPKFLICSSSGARYGETSYAINKNVAGVHVSEVPYDMVILFEAKFDKNGASRDYPVKLRESVKSCGDMEFGRYESDLVYEYRWNLVGGPELLTIENHDKMGCNVLFGDGSTSFVEFKELHELRWNIGEEIETPVYSFSLDEKNISIKENVEKILPVIEIPGLILLIAITVVGSAYILLKHWSKDYLGTYVVTGVLIGVLGYMFGNFSENLSYDSGIYTFLGKVAGCVLGLLAGVCYAVLLSKASVSIKRKSDFKWYAASLAMACGVIYTTFVNLFLMLVYGEVELLTVLVFMPYVIIASYLFGIFSSRFIIKFNEDSAGHQTNAV